MLIMKIECHRMLLLGWENTKFNNSHNVVKCAKIALKYLLLCFGTCGIYYTPLMQELLS